MITDTYLHSVSPSVNGETVICKIQYKEDGNEKIIKIPIAGSFYSDCGLPYNIYEPFGLSKEEFLKLVKLAKVTAAIRKGIELLKYSACSKKALRDKLVLKGFDKVTASKAADYFVENGFISEYDQASLFAVELAEKKLYGSIRIKNELFKKGYDKTIIGEVFDNIDVDFTEICKNRIENTMKKEDFSDKAKASKNVSALIRYGFTYSEIKEAVTKI